MKKAVLFFFTWLTLTASGQGYPFEKDFVTGTVFLKDGSSKAGLIKWFPHQNQKLQFRESGTEETLKYSPADIAGFTVDTFRFMSLYNFDTYADNYPLLGKTSRIKQTFAHVVDTGKFNIYFVLITGYDAISGAIVTYPNFLFQNTQVNISELIAYPYAIRMKEKKYEMAKEKLYTLFRNFPILTEKLKTYSQKQDLLEIVDLVKGINRE